MNNNFNTPILFLIFNRPDTTAMVFEEIRKVKPKRLYVAADGARANVLGEFEKCQVVRDIINVDWDCEVKTLFRDSNLGCKIAVSSAIDWFFKHEEEGIILEDDCLPSQSFFRFCEDLLEKYRNNEEIAIISGNNFNKEKIGEADYYFSRIPQIWGWATWRRFWREYDLDMVYYDKFKEENMIDKIWTDRRFRRYWLYIFDEVVRGKINTWDYQLTFSCFLNNKFCVCPNVNLVSNIGFGHGATNTIVNDKSISSAPVGVIEFPIKLMNKIEYNEFNDYTLNNNSFKNFLIKIVLIKLGVFNFLKNIYRRFLINVNK